MERRQGQAFAQRCDDERAARGASSGRGTRLYRRDYFEDGTPPGQPTETMTDRCVAQSWRCIGVAATEVHRAMARWDPPVRGSGLVQMPTAVRPTRTEPGYSAAYVHACARTRGSTPTRVWAAMAYAALGDAAPLQVMIDQPSVMAAAPTWWRLHDRPYVVAADVYSVAPHLGAEAGAGTTARRDGCTGWSSNVAG